MPYYKDEIGGIHFLDDASFAYLLPVGCVEISDTEAASAQEPDAAQKWEEYKAGAQLALDRTDSVALRCWKAGVNFPPAWQSYTKALRDIVRAASGDVSKALPEPPPYPEGT